MVWNIKNYAWKVKMKNNFEKKKSGRGSTDLQTDEHTHNTEWQQKLILSTKSDNKAFATVSPMIKKALTSQRFEAQYDGSFSTAHRI